MDRTEKPVVKKGTEEAQALQTESEAERLKVKPPQEQKKAEPGSIKVSDPYEFHQGPRQKPEQGPPKDGEIKVKDPYDFHQGPKDGKLHPDIQKDLQKRLEEYKQNLEKSNFSIEFHKGEGPWNSITRQRAEAEAKKSKGQELSPEEQAVLAMNPDDILKESRRMRDRDFKELKDDKGKPRNWYKVGEKSTRYTASDMEQMMKEAEGKFRKEAEQAQKKLEAEEQARKQKELEEAQKQALAQAVEKSVPPLETFNKAKEASGLQFQDMNVMRERVKAVVFAELVNGSLKPEDLGKPPRVGAIYMASEAVTPQQFSEALREQDELRKKATAEKPAPKIGALLRKKLEGSPDRLARFDQADKFYNELLKLLKPEEKK